MFLTWTVLADILVDVFCDLISVFMRRVEFDLRKSDFGIVFYDLI